MRPSRTSLIGAVLLVAVSGCSGDGTSAPTGQVDTSRLWCSGYDYEAAASVAEVRDGAEGAVLGTVASWSLGEEADGAEGRPVLLEVAVDTVSGPVAQQGGTVRVKALADDVACGDEGDAGAARLSVADLGAAVPTGTRVLVLGDVEGADGTLRPRLQGLLLERADGGYAAGIVEQRDVAWGGWPLAPGAGRSGAGFQDLVDEVL